jgi:lactoylglutathione lyase
MRYLHAVFRVRDLDAALAFFVGALGLVEVRRKDVPAGRSSSRFMAASADRN